MTRKRLLCIAPDELNATALLADAMHDWEIRSVSSLADAGRELRDNHRYVVGLLMHDRELQRPGEIDAFLRRHSQMQWVGAFRSRDLDNAACRDLVVEHLCDYHTFPVDPVRMAHTLGHAHGWAMLRRRPQAGLAAPDGASPLVGNCDAIVRLRAQIDRVAKVAAPVLIWGESGSGKELTAQAVHAQSDRADGPFVPINCGAISPSLIHSELFGYERGAFTGATKGKAGLIESANGGTLFLDEIGDLPKDMQVNLLRFLQEQTISRVGSTRSIRVDVRVVAASHVQLQKAVASGAFREDLYYRLAVLPVTVPPLRERRDDLPLLAEHFFKLYGDEKSPRLKGFSNRAIEAILEHDWPGNVRELINRVRRALVMSDNRLIMPEDLGLGGGHAQAAPAALDDARMRTERSALRECLDRSGQNVSRAARDLGVSRTTMYRLLSKHGMRT
ncbi:sigma-54-dependent Fis family transcriptional regulator [Massilia forsythiae]|uniref:Sigma-54-dependent Fis family transcriptional regulator n=1 Tax=Massilia forsythiae TaxID=2728020 RepID=A0A7Z2ZU71_9BURK|nr:sigma-54 dependent transcriptional regulator [Massilia forsythiae]QJE02351.1 sigma-54-dependent Fis family transcriptional regulator [Massilia forsythiae]